MIEPNFGLMLWFILVYMTIKGALAIARGISGNSEVEPSDSAYVFIGCMFLLAIVLILIL